MKKSSVAKPKVPRSLVINRLENVSKDVFRQYFALITELVGSSPGIYALYDSGDLYYVGKSIELRKRVRQHLSDRHLASWTHFSLYLVRREEHIHEIESLLVRIANPKGNRVVPRGKSTGVLVKKLKQLIKRKQKVELDSMFAPTRTSTTKSAPKSNGSLAGLVERKTKLHKTYKGQDHDATLSPKGVITYKGKPFSSASGAARAVIRSKRNVNGWMFWYAQNEAGDWVRLNDLRK